MGSRAVLKLQGLQERLKKLGVRRITDSHTHAFDRQDVRFKPRKGTMASTSYQHYPIERNLRVAQITFSAFQKGYRQVVFGLPAHNVDVNAQNNRMMGWAQKDSRLTPMALVTPKMTGQEIESLVRKGFTGLKPYPEFYPRFRKKIDVNLYLTEPMLKIADKYKLPIILHPVPDASTHPSLERIVNMAQAHPNAHFVLAHMGRGRDPKKTRDLCQAIKSLKNVSLSTSVTTDPRVFKIALQMLGPKRIMFGSDFPWGMMEAALKKLGKRHGSKEVPEKLQGLQYLPKGKYSWALPEMVKMSSPQYRKNLDRMIVSNLEALVGTLEGLFVNGKISEKDIRLIFSGNANKVFKRRID
jgi:predicted TIM-barrel fold metal-dependent hydrolase